MPYDTMTQEELEEYEMLSANPPKCITEQVERFLYLAEKGWACTRAAEDCFEIREADLVLSLVLQQVKADPRLKDVLKSQSAWSKEWDEELENWKESTQPFVAQFDWNGITIECAYVPQCFGGVPNKMAHLQIWSVAPLKARLPITETGYLSRFFPIEKPHEEECLIASLRDWLDEEAQSPKWIAHQKEQMQLTLF